VKINEIAVGTVYWYDTRQDWGKYLAPAYDRGPVVRVDAKRYTAYSYGRTKTEAREDPKGRYGAFRKVKEDGSPEDGSDATRIYYLVSTHIRDTMTATRERYDAERRRVGEAERLRQREAADALGRAATLRARLEAAGLADLIAVRATDGTGWHATSPHVEVAISGHPVQSLNRLLDIVDRALSAEKAAYLAGFDDGDAYDEVTEEERLARWGQHNGTIDPVTDTSRGWTHFINYGHHKTVCDCPRGADHPPVVI